MAIGLKKPTIEQRIYHDMAKVAKTLDLTVSVGPKSWKVFCGELAHYRIMDAYSGSVIAKGHSVNLNCWYVEISHNLPEGFILEP